MRTPAGGVWGDGLKIRTHADKGGRGENGKNFADVLYGWPLIRNGSVI